MTQGKLAFTTAIALVVMRGPSSADADALDPTVFFSVAPCRVVDTRRPDGPLGGPALVGGADRVFPLAGVCGIPADATAVSVNVAVIGGTAAGNLRLHAGGTAVPFVAAINYSAGQTRSNNAIVGLNPAGDLAAFAGPAGTVHFVLDVNGYFGPNGQPGDFCAGPPECASGFCVDDVCCNAACEGACEACDVSGAAGTCSPVPAGTDPDQECGDVSCVGYFHSWSGDTCRRRADVTAAQADCGGAGACQTAAQECGSSTPGPVTTTCHDNCQNPNLSTCTGTTAGACLNVNPGTQTCGVGACTATVNQCSNGAPLTCVPGPSSPETCNDVDDNCDGTTDNGAFADAFEPNPDCGAVGQPSGVGSDQSATLATMTLYPAGDVDYFRIRATETDNFCGCGSFSFDEDYEMRVTLTVPPGAGSYELCMNTNSCGWPAGYCFQVDAGASLTARQFLDGACGPGQNDAYDVYVRVSPLNSPGYECRPYTLSYTFDAGLCR